MIKKQPRGNSSRLFLRADMESAPTDVYIVPAEAAGASPRPTFRTILLTNPETRVTIHLTIKLIVKCYKARCGMGLQKTMKALSDPIRREILNLLKNGRMAAGDIASRFDISDAAISRHLSVLKEANLIRDTREGKFIFYDLNASVLEELLLWVSDLKGESDHA